MYSISTIYKLSNKAAILSFPKNLQKRAFVYSKKVHKSHLFQPKTAYNYPKKLWISLKLSIKSGATPKASIMNKLASTLFRKVPFFQLIILAKSYKIVWLIVLHSRNCPTSIHTTLTRRYILLQMNDTAYRGKMYRFSSSLCNLQ